MIDDAAERYNRAACGLLTTNADGLIIEINDTLLRWLDRQRGQVVGQLWLTELLTRGGRIFLETHYRPQLRLQGLVRELALDLITSDGRRLPVLLNATTDVNDPAACVEIAILDARERRSYEQELLNARNEAEESARNAAAMAQTLQQTLVPSLPPEIPLLTTAVAFHPAAGEVGGDFYDVFPLGSGEWAVVLGDVSGKGVGAAVVATLVRHTVRALMTTGASPAETLAGLHHVLARDTPGMFCTSVALRLTRSAKGWSVRLSSGGHPPAVRLGTTGPAVMIDATGPLIGALPNSVFGEVTFDITTGDTLILYTDGITEARRNGEHFGVERLIRTLENGSRDPDRAVARLVARAVDFQGGQAHDDVAVLAIGVPRPLDRSPI